jgi:hypothetical protein
MRVLLSRAGRIVNRAASSPGLTHIAATVSHAMPGPMADERMIKALERLEQALLRAEAAGAAAEQTGAAAASARESLREQLAGLEARHERLRASAESAVAQLDGLIASGAEVPRG